MALGNQSNGESILISLIAIVAAERGASDNRKDSQNVIGWI